MDWGVVLTLWTVRLSLACYAIVVAGALVPRATTARLRASRVIWTAGCLLFWLHVGAAFHFYHDWSHAHAVAHTAAETKRLLGWEFGRGIYFSYLFMILWAIDAAWLWRTPRICQRAGWTRGLVHAYLFFIAVNGTIVFEQGPVRWAAIVCCVVIAILALARVVLPWRNPSLST
jgi:hypothetical protein